MTQGSRSFKDLAVESTIQKWQTGGCYAVVGKDWLGQKVAVFFPDGKVEYRVVAGSEGGQKYIAQITEDRSGQSVVIVLPEAMERIFKTIKRNPGYLLEYKRDMATDGADRNVK